MKKNLSISLGRLLMVALTLSACTKTIPDQSSLPQSVSQAAAQNHNCQLTFLDWGDGSSFRFHYNNKGLADQWVLDYGDDFPHDVYSLVYDENNRLVSSVYTFLDFTLNIFFTYTGNNITKSTWIDPTTNTVFDERFYTFNSRGQMTRQDDYLYDVHVTFVYNAAGHATGIDYYFGSDLLFSFANTFNTPNRDPLLAINGLPFGFPIFYYQLWDRWWETSDKFILHDGGNQYVLLDDDPAQTVMHTGTQNYLTSVSFYDRISQSSRTVSFEYQNCEGENESTNQASKHVTNDHGVINKARIIRSLLHTPSKELKQRFIELRNQYLTK